MKLSTETHARQLMVLCWEVGTLGTAAYLLEVGHSGKVSRATSTSAPASQSAPYWRAPFQSSATVLSMVDYFLLKL